MNLKPVNETHPSSPPNTRFRVGLPLALVGLGMAFLGGRFVGNKPPPLESPPLAAQKEEGEKGVVRFEKAGLKLANLTIGAASRTIMTFRVPVTGQVEANPSGAVTVTPRVEGKVIKLLVSVGDRVQPGQTLAVIESEKLHEAQVAYRLSVKRLELARQILARRQRLASLGEYGKPGIEQARTRLTQIQGEVQKAKAEVSVSLSSVTQAQNHIHALQVALKQAQAQQEVAETRAARAETLYKEELLSRQDLEQTRAETQRARTEVEAARVNIAQGEAAREGTNSHLAAARTTLETAQRQQRIAAQSLKRAEAVYRGNFATSKEVEEARSAFQQAQIESEGTLDDVELLGGRPGDLHEIPVKAPIAGRVTERTVSLGQTVAAGATLMTLLDTQSVWVQFNIYPKELSRIKTGQEVTATSESLPGAVLRGTLSSVGETVDKDTRTVKVRAIFRNTRLRPGAFVSGLLLEPGQTQVITVPQDAVQEVNGKPVVYVPGEKEGEFQERPIEVGERSEGKVEVRSGLKSGEKIVVKNAFLIKSQAMKSELGEE